MGGMYQQDHGDNAHNLVEMCVSLFSFCFVSHSHGVADGARLFYTTPQPITLNAMRQCALHLLFVPSPDGAFDSSAIPVHNSPISQIHSTDHIVIPAGWDSRGKVVVLRNGTLTQSMALGFGARFVFRRRAKNVHVPRKPSKYILVLMYTFPSHAMNTKPTPLAPLNNPTTEPAFMRRTMTRTTTRQPQPTRHIPHAHRYICSPPRASRAPWARRHSRFWPSG